MTILRNSAKCDKCGKEIVSKHQHDFQGHSCDSAEDMLFFIDGGNAYFRRGGSGFTDTSIVSEADA